MIALSPTFDGARTIPSELITDLMLALLQLKQGDKLLEIGTGSGYQTKAWAKTGAEVHSIEIEPWVDPTKITGDCVFLHSGDAKHGLPQEAPFTAIVATCGVTEIPKAWEDQLDDGGCLLAPIGEPACQKLTLFRKHGKHLVPERVAAYVKFQMLREKPVPKPVKPVYASR